MSSGTQAQPFGRKLIHCMQPILSALAIMSLNSRARKPEFSLLATLRKKGAEGGKTTTTTKNPYPKSLFPEILGQGAEQNPLAILHQLKNKITVSVLYYSNS